MVCPYCQQKTQVSNSRHQKRSLSIWRRRSCVTCQATFTTEEHFDYSTVWLIEKESKTEIFSRDRLFLSILKALPSDESSLKTAKELTDTVIKSLLKHHKAVYTVTQITNEVETVLSRFNASVGLKYVTEHSRIASARKLQKKLDQLPFN